MPEAEGNRWRTESSGRHTPDTSCVRCAIRRKQELSLILHPLVPRVVVLFLSDAAMAWRAKAYKFAKEALKEKTRKWRHKCKTGGVTDIERCGRIARLKIEVKL
jgi:hypothetical protein